MYYELALFSYLIDLIFGEFEKLKYLKHPIVLIGNYISWFESRFYKDSIFRGFLLCSSLIILIFFISYFLSLVDNIFFQALLCSFEISSKMLYESVKNVIISSDPKLAVSMLVSRDTKDMSSSDVIKL